MIRRYAQSVLVAGLLSGCMASDPVVMRPDAAVAGLSQGDYAARWWQWANAGHAEFKPYNDPTGALCGLNQAGPVWFLAGTDGADRASRRCRVPAGRYVFFPVINMIGFPTGDRPFTCEEAFAFAADNNDHLGQADVTIDGRPVASVWRYRQRSRGCFDQAPTDRSPRMRVFAYPAATDGYWLMLRPLTPGTHVIRVRAAYDNPNPEAPLGRMEQDFEYELQVGPEAPPSQLVEAADVVRASAATSVAQNRSPTGR